MTAMVHSATVLVRDQDEAIEFYVNKLGFEKREDSPFGEGSRWVVVGPPGRETGLALLRPEDMGTPVEKLGGHTGISLVVDDVAKTYEAWKSKGVEFKQPPETMPWGAVSTWFMDQDGNEYFLTNNRS